MILMAKGGHLLSEVNSNGQSIKDYIYMEGEYVAHVEQTGDTANGETREQVFYPLNDHLGQPMMMFRADEKISHEQYTDPYGKLNAEYIDTSIGTGPQPQNIGLPGQYHDVESGYNYNWNRYYDPTTANYLQSDLIGQDGGVNTYLYAGANPVMNTDAEGLKICKKCAEAIVIVRSILESFNPAVYIKGCSIHCGHLLRGSGNTSGNTITLNTDDYANVNDDNYVEYTHTIAHELLHCHQSWHQLFQSIPPVTSDPYWWNTYHTNLDMAAQNDAIAVAPLVKKALDGKGCCK